MEMNSPCSVELLSVGFLIGLGLLDLFKYRTTLFVCSIISDEGFGVCPFSFSQINL